MTYGPRQWYVIKITSEEFGTVYKIFATWGHDEWKMSSGIIIDQVKDLGHGWESPQESGSVYFLPKNGFGKPWYWRGVYDRIIETLNSAPDCSYQTFDSFEKVLEDFTLIKS